MLKAAEIMERSPARLDEKRELLDHTTCSRVFVVLEAAAENCDSLLRIRNSGQSLGFANPPKKNGKPGRPSMAISAEILNCLTKEVGEGKQHKSSKKGEEELKKDSRGQPLSARLPQPPPFLGTNGTPSLILATRGGVGGVGGGGRGGRGLPPIHQKQ